MLCKPIEQFLLCFSDGELEPVLFDEMVCHEVVIDFVLLADAPLNYHQVTEMIKKSPYLHCP